MEKWIVQPLARTFQHHRGDICSNQESRCPDNVKRKKRGLAGSGGNIEYPLSRRDARRGHDHWNKQTRPPPDPSVIGHTINSPSSWRMKAWPKVCAHPFLPTAGTQSPLTWAASIWRTLSNAVRANLANHQIFMATSTPSEVRSGSRPDQLSARRPVLGRYRLTPTTGRATASRSYSHKVP